MCSDIKRGNGYGYIVGCLGLLPPLSVAPPRSDTSESVYAAFLKGADVCA